jgi:hypothetical protein
LEKLLAIFDPDVLYASRLMEYFKKMVLIDFEIILFTRLDSLTDFIRYQPVEVLLYGADSLSADVHKDNIKYVFYLCPDMKQIKDKEEAIYKYQPAGRIASDILTAYTRLEDKQHNSPAGEMTYVSIFAPVPGIEKMSYAWSFAKELSIRKKVLYIAFDLLPTKIMQGQEDYGQSMSELLYYLKENRSDYMDKFKSYINYSERLSYLSGPVHGFDILSLNREEAGRFMENLKKYTDYDTVIFYLGIYTEATMELLEKSNEIYIVTCDMPYEELVLKEWERQARLSGLSINELKIDKLKLTKDEANC